VDLASLRRLNERSDLADTLTEYRRDIVIPLQANKCFAGDVLCADLSDLTYRDDKGRV
jgi:hypothetical protein